MDSQVQPLEPAACNTLMALSKVLFPLEEEGRLAFAGENTRDD